MLKETNKLIKDATETLHEMNKKFDEASKRNKEFSDAVNQSIDEKSKRFEANRKKREKHFSFIRNKQQ